MKRSRAPIARGGRKLFRDSRVDCAASRLRGASLVYQGHPNARNGVVGGERYRLLFVSFDLRDRAAEIVAKAEKSGADESLKAARIKQLKVAAGAPPTMRVEIRGMKIGTTVDQLLTVGARRFERFVFVELQAIKGLTEFERRNFVALVRDSSLKEAVALHTGQPTYKHVKKALTQTATWWEPEGLWARGIKMLRKSGIFPKDAFARGG